MVIIFRHYESTISEPPHEKIKNHKNINNFLIIFFLNSEVIFLIKISHAYSKQIQNINKILNQFLFMTMYIYFLPISTLHLHQIIKQVKSNKQKYNIIFMKSIEQTKNIRSKSETRTKQLEKIGFKHQVIKLRKDYNNSNRYQEIKHQERSKSLKNLSKDFHTSKSGKFLDPTKIITVSASKWVIFDYYSSKYLRGYRAHDPYELSIFSKLVVYCTLNTLITKHKIDTSRFQTIVTPTVCKFYKNSKLKVDDIIILDHLIHLLLMDEGEQYELVIALNIGAYLQKKRKKEYYSVYDADQKMYKVHMAEFYELVNSFCQTLKLQNIRYIEADPEKRKQLNKCSAADIANLSSQCLKIPSFKQILKLESKTVQIKYINKEGHLQVRKLELKNKTVNNQFISYFNVCRNWEENQFMNSSGAVFYQQIGIKPIVVVLLGSYGPHDRQKDIQQIIEWYLKTCKTEQEKNQKNKQKTQQKKKSLQYDEQQDPETVKISKKELKKIQKIQNRFNTEESKKLDIILEQKLKGGEPQKYKIRKRTITLI